MVCWRITRCGAISATQDMDFLTRTSGASSGLPALLECREGLVESIK